MALIDLDKFLASFITEMKECSQMRNFSIPRCIKKALEEQGLEYKDGEIVKSQRRVSAEAKEAGYGESKEERIMEKIIATIHLYYGEPLEDEAKEMIDWLEKQGQNPTWSEEDERMYNIVFEEYKNRQYYSHPTLEDYDISGQILGWLKSLKDRVKGE